MTPSEAVLLCRYAKALCPQQHFDQYTPDAWHDLMGHLELRDAKDAALVVAQRTGYVTPTDVLAEVRRVRNERARAAEALDVPPEIEAIEDPDEFTEAYRQWRAQVRSALADGRPVPDQRLALPASPETKQRAIAAIEQIRRSHSLAEKEAVDRRQAEAARHRARRAAFDAEREPEPEKPPAPPVEETLAKHQPTEQEIKP